MRQRFAVGRPILLCAAFAILSYLPVFATQPSTPASLQHFSIETEILPAPGKPDSYLCHVKLWDLDTDRLITAPHLVFGVNVPATARIDVESAGVTVDIQLAVETATMTTEVHVEVQQAGKITARFKSRHRLL